MEIVKNFDAIACCFYLKRHTESSCDRLSKLLSQKGNIALINEHHFCLVFFLLLFLGNYAYIPIDSGLPPFTQSREKGVFLKVGASSHKNIVFELCVLALD